jgi:hypothetical protein
VIKDVDIKKATDEDIRIFYPDGSPFTIQAWVASYKGTPTCLAGVIYEKTRFVPFSDVIPNDAPKMTVWRTVLELWGLIKGLELPLTTGVQCKKSEFLERLGFKHIGSAQGWEMYKCL